MLRCGRFRGLHDIQNCAEVWEEKPSDLPIDLLYRWRSLCHVCQGVWNCCEVDPGWQQPVHTSIDLCLHYLVLRLHHDADELFQQGSEPVPHIDVSNITKHHNNRANSSTVSIRFITLRLPLQLLQLLLSSTAVSTLPML